MARRTRNRRTRRTRRTRRKSTMRSTLERSLRKTIERSIRKSLKKLTNRKTKKKKRKTKRKKKLQRGGDGQDKALIIKIFNRKFMKLGKYISSTVLDVGDFNPDIQQTLQTKDGLIRMWKEIITEYLTTRQRRRDAFSNTEDRAPGEGKLEEKDIKEVLELIIQEDPARKQNIIIGGNILTGAEFTDGNPIFHSMLLEDMVKELIEFYEGQLRRPAQPVPKKRPPPLPKRAAPAGAAPVVALEPAAAAAQPAAAIEPAALEPAVAPPAVAAPAAAQPEPVPAVAVKGGVGVVPAADAASLLEIIKTTIKTYNPLLPNLYTVNQGPAEKKIAVENGLKDGIDKYIQQQRGRGVQDDAIRSVIGALARDYFPLNESTAEPDNWLIKLLGIKEETKDADSDELYNTPQYSTLRANLRAKVAAAPAHAGHFSLALGPVAGRIPDTNWIKTTNDEGDEYYSSTVYENQVREMPDGVRWAKSLAVYGDQLIGNTGWTRFTDDEGNFYFRKNVEGWTPQWDIPDEVLAFLEQAEEAPVIPPFSEPAAEPAAAEPAALEPAAALPVVALPVVAQQESAEPVAPEPVAAEPVAGRIPGTNWIKVTDDEGEYYSSTVGLDDVWWVPDGVRWAKSLAVYGDQLIGNTGWTRFTDDEGNFYFRKNVEGWTPQWDIPDEVLAFLEQAEEAPVIPPFSEPAAEPAAAEPVVAQQESAEPVAPEPVEDGEPVVAPVALEPAAAEDGEPVVVAEGQPEGQPGAAVAGVGGMNCGEINKDINILGERIKDLEQNKLDLTAQLQAALAAAGPGGGGGGEEGDAALGAKIAGLERDIARTAAELEKCHQEKLVLKEKLKKLIKELYCSILAKVRISKLAHGGGGGDGSRKYLLPDPLRKDIGLESPDLNAPFDRSAAPGIPYYWILFALLSDNLLDPLNSSLGGDKVLTDEQRNEIMSAEGINQAAGEGPRQREYIQKLISALLDHFFAAGGA